MTGNKPQGGSWTDIHTHTLPCVDDGAKDLEVCKAMLLRQAQIGVKRIFLTPHFYCQQEDLQSFLSRRANGAAALKSIWDGAAMPQVKLGAEVRYSPQLLSMDLRMLTLGNSDYLLLELPSQHYPPYLERVVSGILEMGIIPILAHVERYGYFRKQPELLRKIIQIGALTQVNAESVCSAQDRGFAKACLRHMLAQFVASDSHNMADRLPNLNGLSAALPREQCEMAERFAYAVWENSDVPSFDPTSMTKHLWGYQ